LGHSEIDISQTHDPISQAAPTYETTELEKHVGAGWVQSAAVVHASAGGTLGGMLGAAGFGSAGPAVTSGGSETHCPELGSHSTPKPPQLKTSCFQWHCPSSQLGSLYTS
jgi:hypothetical protein